PPRQKCYLVAALGSLLEEERIDSRVWSVPTAADGQGASEAMAAVADALALQIAADGKLQQLQSRLDAQTRVAEQAGEEVSRRGAEVAELGGQLAQLGETDGWQSRLDAQARVAEQAAEEVSRRGAELAELRGQLAQLAETAGWQSRLDAQARV